MLLNLHTHILKKQAGEQIIFNQIIPDSEEALEDFTLPNTDSWLSVGIHPWFIHEKSYQFQLKKLSAVISEPSIKLIGECGLDRLKGAELPLQEEIFIKQIRLAEEYQKPLVIHCLRCYNELLSIKKIVRPKVPMIVHGFNSKIEIARQLIDKGFYLSLGAALLIDGTNAQKALAEIPVERLFLETDDKEVGIAEIYNKAAEIKQFQSGQLQEIIYENFLGLSI